MVIASSSAISGLGAININSANNFDTATMFVPIIILMVMAIGPNSLIGVVECWSRLGKRNWRWDQSWASLVGLGARNFQTAAPRTNYRDNSTANIGLKRCLTALHVMLLRPAKRSCF
jgi:hypothetical protein